MSVCTCLSEVMHCAGLRTVFDSLLLPVGCRSIRRVRSVTYIPAGSMLFPCGSPRRISSSPLFSSAFAGGFDASFILPVAVGLRDAPCDGEGLRGACGDTRKVRFSSLWYEWRQGSLLFRISFAGCDSSVCPCAFLFCFRAFRCCCDGIPSSRFVRSGWGLCTLYPRWWRKNGISNEIPGSTLGLVSM